MTTLTQLIEHYCPNGVEYVKLGDVASNLDRLRKPVTAKDRIPGPYPYYGANGVQDWVDDYLFEGDFVLLGEDGSVIHEDGTPFVHWAAGKIWVNNHAHILTVLDAQLSLRFLFHALKNTDVSNFVTGGTQLKINQKNLNRIPIPLPPREVQDAIVERLDAFTKLIESLDSEIALREKRFEYFREQLLNLDESDGVEYVELGSVCTRILAGGDKDKDTIKGQKEPTEERPYPVYSNGVGESALYGYSSAFRIDAESVTISARGTIGHHAVRAPFYTPIVRLLTLIPDLERTTSSFLDYALTTTAIGGTEGGISQLTVPMVKTFQIPLPSLEVQQDIADKLDTMQALIDNLKQERELRQAQFEYYREKLLTFNS